MNNHIAEVIHAWNKAYPRMNIRARPGTRVMFDGCGGYEGEKTLAAECLVVRQVYEVERVEIGSSSSSVSLKGIKGNFNTCLFSEAPATTSLDAENKQLDELNDGLLAQNTAVGAACAKLEAENAALRAEVEAGKAVVRSDLAIIAERTEELVKLRAEVEALELAEEGAKEAFGHVVRDKRDLEAECKRFRALLDSAHQTIQKLYMEGTK